jgi:prepilin-type N-terminal cleavage/methylation domain-containing protein
MRKTKAFTLVELLVVISIIAVLLAILMPALQKARRQAQRIICVSDVKAQFTVQLSYSSTYNGKFPPHSDANPWYLQTWMLAQNGAGPYTPSGAPNPNQFSQGYSAYSKGWITNPKILLCPLLISKFGHGGDIYAGGMFTTLGYPSGKGTGDVFARWLDTKPTSGQSLVGIPYNWFAGYRFSGMDPPGSPRGTGVLMNFNYTCTVSGKWSGYQVNEPPWPTQSMDCTASRAFIAHNICYMSDSMWDVSHGGNYRLDPGDENFDKFMGSEDNPVGYADGHAVWTKKTNIHPRATIGQGGWMEYFY